MLSVFLHVRMLLYSSVPVLTSSLLALHIKAYQYICSILLCPSNLCNKPLYDTEWHQQLWLILPNCFLNYLLNLITFFFFLISVTVLFTYGVFFNVWLSPSCLLLLSFYFIAFWKLRITKFCPSSSDILKILINIQIMIYCITIHPSYK